MEEKNSKLGLWNIIGLALGSAIGTGIFMLLGYGIAYTGRSISLVVAVGCFFMLLAYWYDLAMPMLFVFKGGDYSMRTMMFNPMMSGVNAWFTIIQMFSLSGCAITLAQYCAMLWPALESYQMPFALLVMTAFFLMSIRGSKFMTVLENAITVLLVGALALFVIIGVPQVDTAEYFKAEGFFHGGFGGFMSAISVMGWACMGTTGVAVSMSAVTKNAKRNIPLAIIVTTLLLAVVYAAMAYVAGGVLPYEQIAGQNIAVTAQVIMPKGLYTFFVVGGGICAVASTLMASIAMIRYPVIQVANDGWLPAVFKKTTKDGYPYVGYLATYIISIVPILMGMTLDAVVSMTMVPLMLICAYVNYSCVSLPKKFPEQWEKRSIRIPKWMFCVCSVLGAFCSLYVAYNLFKDMSSRDAILTVILLIVLVALAYIRLKQGAVTREKLEADRQRIIQEAISYVEE